MNADTARILSDPSLVAVRENHFARLSTLFDGVDSGGPFTLFGFVIGTGNDEPDGERWLDNALDALTRFADGAKDRRVFRPLCLQYNPHGVHFIDPFFGAEVFQMEDGSWQAKYLDAPIGELAYPDLESNACWKRTQALTRAFVKREAPAVLFGLPTIASPLNIAINLYGQKILEAMLIEPAAAAHDLRVIRDLLCDLHRWYRGILPPDQLQCVVPEGRSQPRGCGQLCGCSTQLLSAGLYDAFVAPLDAELLSVYPRGGMIHLCGAHTQHIATWLEMESLRALQLNDRAAEDLPIYFEEMPRCVFYVNPCPGVPVERILEITGGRRVVIVADQNPYGSGA